MSPGLNPDTFAMAQAHWEAKSSAERKAVFAKKVEELPDAQLNQLPRERWFLQMNVRNAPKAWFDPYFDPTPLWEGVQPNCQILDQVYLRLAREVDILQGLESFDLPLLLAYGQFEFLVPPLSCWEPFMPHFKKLQLQLFERSAHSPQYEEAPLFDSLLLNWMAKNDLGGSVLPEKA